MYKFLRRGSIFYDYINRESSRPAVFSAAEMCNIQVPINIAFKFQELYVPIIKLFSRGGRIRYQNGELTCGSIGRSRSISTDISSAEPKDISDEILDEIDY